MANKIFISSSLLWSKWVKKYKCFTEYENDIKNKLNKLSDLTADSTKKTLSYKNICLNVMRQHGEKTLVKYKTL